MKEEFVSYKKVKVEEHEILGAGLISKDNRQLDVFGVYRPGKADAQLFDKIINYVGNDTERNIIVAGDLNLPNVKWEGNANDRKHDQQMVNKLLWE